MKKIIRTVLFLGMASLQLSALELSSVFSNHMVLQQKEPIKIWGKADPGAPVEVSFAGQTRSTRVEEDGSWELMLAPLEASFEERILTVASGSTQLSFEDVLVGEVWLASGQSNMGWTINKSVDSDINLLGANDPHLRLFRVSYQPSNELMFSSDWKWEKDGFPGLEHFSAVAYQFGRDLRKTLQVPVGIIQSAVGGTPTVAWTRREAIENTPQLKAIADDWAEKLSNFDEIHAAWEKEYADWREAKGIANENYELHKRQGAPRMPDGADSPKRPTSLANGMIAPVAGYTIRGAIWYQGEQDANKDPEIYDERLRVMIEDWRDWWGDPDMPFGIVQLPDFMKPQERPANSYWAKLRESQRLVAQGDPNVGLVVTIGLGEADDIHPPEKFTVARRLARWALADVYQKIELRGGPEIVSAIDEGPTVLLTFDETGSGLHAWDAESLTGFTASDTMEEPEIWWQTNFYEVDAEIVSESEIRLKKPDGRAPIRVRYGWQSNPVDANLANKERLPASPFEVLIAE